MHIHMTHYETIQITMMRQILSCTQIFAFQWQ